MAHLINFSVPVPLWAVLTAAYWLFSAGACSWGLICYMASDGDPHGLRSLKPGPRAIAIATSFIFVFAFSMALFVVMAVAMFNGCKGKEEPRG